MVSKWYDVLGRVLHFTGPKISSYIVEFIGTFFLVLTIGFNVVAANPLAPIAIGSQLMVMIFMGGHISGAHFNPAVTFGVRLTGRDHISTLNAFIYLIMQVIAGILAPLVVWGVTDKTFAPTPAPGISEWKALVVEFFYTFALVSVMLNSATTKSQNANSFFGLAIGFTVLSAAFSVGGISGGAFNPAVGTGPTIINALLGKGPWKYIWIYWVGPLTGALLAAMVFRITNSTEFRKAAAISTASQNFGKGKGKDSSLYTPIQNQEDEPM